MPVTAVGVVPFVYARFQGDVPVSATDTVAELPAHTDPVPLTAAVAGVATVTTAEPVILPAVAAPFASLSAVTV